jgi:hypothetical protein
VEAFKQSVEPDGKSYMMMSIRWWGNNDGDLLKTVHEGWIKESTNQWHYGKKKTNRTFKPWVEDIYADTVLVWGLLIVNGKVTGESHERIEDSLAESARFREEKDSDEDAPAEPEA